MRDCDEQQEEGEREAPCDQAWRYSASTSPKHVPIALLPAFAAMLRHKDPAHMHQGALMLRKLLSVASERRFRVHKVIDSGAVPSLVACFTHVNRPSLQLDACQALELMMHFGSTAHRRHIVERARLLTNVSSLLISHNSEVKAAGLFLALNTDCRLFSGGDLLPLMPLVLRATDELRREGTAKKAMVEEEERRLRVERRAKGEQSVTDDDDDDDEPLDVVASRLDLINATSDAFLGMKSNYLVDVDRDLIPLLDWLAESLVDHADDAGIVDAVCVAMASATKWGREDIIQAVLDRPRVLPIITELVAVPVAGAVSLLANLLVGTDQQVRVILDSGEVIHSLRMIIMEPHKAQVTLSACWALAHLAADGSAIGIPVLLTEPSFIPPLIACLNYPGDAQIGVAALCAIANIAKAATAEQMIAVFDRLCVVHVLSPLCQSLRQRRWDEQDVALERILLAGEAVARERQLPYNPAARIVMEENLLPPPRLALGSIELSGATVSLLLGAAV